MVKGMDRNTPAAPISIRIKMAYKNGKYDFSDWDIEDMGIPRVMGDAVLRPNGNTAVVNGDQSGWAAQPAPADEPALTSLLYNPCKKSGNRYSSFGHSFTPRMYHYSTAILLPDGDMLIGGCRACGPDDFETSEKVDRSDGGEELRWETISPMTNQQSRPKITASPDAMTYGSSYTVNYASKNAIEAVSIVAPSSVTHSMNFGPRVVFVEFEVVSDEEMKSHCLKHPDTEGQQHAIHCGRHRRLLCWALRGD